MKPGKIDASLNSKLEKVEWGDFRIGDLFEIWTGSLLSNDELKIWNIPRISAKSDNNWILGNYNSEGSKKSRHFENFISVNFFGTDGWIFYHQYKASVEMKVHTLKIPNIEFNIKTWNFIATVLKQSLTGFWYWNQLSSSKLKDLNFTIQLPTKNWKIDFDFMENFIDELEKEKIEKLNNYLEVTWLKDYNLTGEEKKILEDFESGKVEWGEYKLGDLFDINTYKKRFDANKVDILGTWKPYVVRTALNNWIRWYINEDKQFLNEWNTISFWQDTATMFYQEKPYFTWDKIKILKSKSDSFNKWRWLFSISTMTKSFSSFTWWSSSFNINIIGNQWVQLPTKNNKPDYKIMEILISAIQKMVIKDVVLYSEEKMI